MGACLCRLLCCRRAKPANEYKKLDARSAGPIDLEGGQMGDDEDWDDFTPQEAVAGPSQPAVEEEPEAAPSSQEMCRLVSTDATMQMPEPSVRAVWCCCA